jgi:hypothetical protein
MNWLTKPNPYASTLVVVALMTAAVLGAFV